MQIDNVCLPRSLVFERLHEACCFEDMIINCVFFSEGVAVNSPHEFCFVLCQLTAGWLVPNRRWCFGVQGGDGLPRGLVAWDIQHIEYPFEEPLENQRKQTRNKGRNQYAEYFSATSFKMSCNGCRVLRKGCSDNCVLRPCLQWIESSEAQGYATVFVAKFFGRAGLMGFISAVPDNQRPGMPRFLRATLQSLFVKRSLNS